jgi:hypothetical protein
MTLVYRSRRRSRQPDYENGDENGIRFRSSIYGWAFMPPWRFWLQASLLEATVLPDDSSLKAGA